MRLVLAATAASFVLAGQLCTATAQVNVYTKKVGKQQITTLTPVQAPAVNGMDFGDAKATGTILQAQDWTCGVSFTDQNNRRWRLVNGPPLSKKPNNVPGWLIQTTKGKLAFYSTSGSLFCQTGIQAANNE